MDSLFQAAASKIGASSLDGLEKGFQALQKDAQSVRPSKPESQSVRPSEPESDSEDSSSSCNIEEAASDGSAAKEDPYDVPSPEAEPVDLASSSSSSSSDSPAPSGLTAEMKKRLKSEGDELNYSALKKMMHDSLPLDQRPKRDNKVRPRGGKKITRKKAKKKMREQEAAKAKSVSAHAKVPTPLLQQTPSKSAPVQAPGFSVNVAAFKAAGLPVPPPPTPGFRPVAAPLPPAVPKRSNLSARLGASQGC